MGCCCDEDDGDILMNSNFPSSSHSPSPTPSTVISSMNSHFSVLSSADILHLIFQNLPISDLARASCVCQVWNSVQREIVTKAFLAPWKLKDVVGDPLSGSFWRDSNIGKFAISHRIVHGDSVAGLAVKYSVQVMDIKHLNNMVGYHGIPRLRERLLIPISNPDILLNRTCFIELDVYANREVAVLYPNDVPDRRRNRCLSTRVSSEESKRRVVYSLKRSMQVDNETTQYYLSISNGDPRAALAEFSQDLRWERQVGHS